MVNSPAHQPSVNLPSSSRGLPEHLATSLKSCLLKRKGKLYFTSVSQKAGVLPRGGLGALALRASENAHADPRGSEARAPAYRPSPARDSPLPLRWPEGEPAPERSPQHQTMVSWFPTPRPSRDCRTSPQVSGPTESETALL